MSTVGFEPEGMTQAKSDALHFKKNAPPKPTIDGAELEFPPYEFRRYPCAMYHASDPTSPKEITDEDEWRNHRSRGWGDSPDDAKQIAEQREADRMADAAVRAHDDKGMSAKAKTEVEQLEQSTDNVVSEVPAPKKRARGRPKRAVPAPQE